MAQHFERVTIELNPVLRQALLQKAPHQIAPTSTRLSISVVERFWMSGL
jgi:hypothetical protein